MSGLAPTRAWESGTGCLKRKRPIREETWQQLQAETADQEEHRNPCPDSEPEKKCAETRVEDDKAAKVRKHAETRRFVKQLFTSYTDKAVLQRENTALKTENAALKSQCAALRSELAALKPRSKLLEPLDSQAVFGDPHLLRDGHDSQLGFMM